MTPEVQQILREGEIGRARAVLAKHNTLPANDPNTGDFRDFGEFAQRVAHAGQKSLPANMRDRRLIALNVAPTTGSEAIGGDGGFAVPPAFLDGVSRLLMADDTLLNACDVRTATSNTFVFPKDETTPWQSTGGVQVAWDGEEAQLAQSKPSLTNGTIKLNKVTALVPVTDEVLEDSNALQQHLEARVPEALSFAIERVIIAGTGAGQPKGVLASGALKTVAKESGQSSATVVFHNVTKMWNALAAPSRKRAIWLAHPDVDQQLQSLQFPITTGGAAGAPIYSPPSADAPNGRLLGRPIMLSQACSAAGTPGDLILMDPKAYVVALKKIKSSVSIHLWFDYDITAFKFVLRVGGQPWTDSLVPDFQSGSNKRGYFTTIAAR